MREQLRDLGMKNAPKHVDHPLGLSHVDVLPSKADEKKQQRMFIYSALGSFIGMALFILFILWLSFKVLV